MRPAFRTKRAGIMAVAIAGCCAARAQAPGVPICDRGRQEAQYKTTLLNAAQELVASDDALKPAKARQQLKRTSCKLALPEANTQRLPARDICIAARHSHLRVGWSYLCPKCGKWHLNLAGGYALTAGGAVATCFHVVEPGQDVREGGLVAVDEQDTVFAVAEVLAAHRESDACIVRVVGERFTPLPLNTNIYPGDTAYCYSDPAGHRDYFSAGIVNRFYQRPGSRPTGARSSADAAPMLMNVSTDWAPGSSGSAVLDECGNAIGHVALIAAVPGKSTSTAEDGHTNLSAAIVFHEAVSARDVLRLVKGRRD